MTTALSTAWNAVATTPPRRPKLQAPASTASSPKTPAVCPRDGKSEARESVAATWAAATRSRRRRGNVVGRGQRGNEKPTKP